MSDALIVLLAGAGAVALAALLTLWRVLGAGAREPGAVISDSLSSTSVDDSTGAVRSVQSADVLIPPEALQELWTPINLERLARTYWRFLTRVTLGLIQVRYSEQERSVVLLFRPLKLLTFHAPEYEMDGEHGLVRWRIARGLLVARRGRDGGGYLQIEARREDAAADVNAQARLHMTVEVANFYPSIASGLGRWIYNATQSRIHVIVTNRFLHSLARLDLAESRVGRFRAQRP